MGPGSHDIIISLCVLLLALPGALCIVAASLLTGLLVGPRGGDSCPSVLLTNPVLEMYHPTLF